MRRYTRRAGLLPLVVAVLLTLAAGLSLAEEHSSYPGERASVRHPVATVVHDAAPITGVGSRALGGD